MASRDEATLPATRPKSRKSLAHVPSSKIMDQENMTTDFASLAAGKRGGTFEKVGRKSRSKSIGPGGLDALTDTSGNRRKSLASVPHPVPKSILKPTMPPLREIPAHKSSRNQSPKKNPLRAIEGNLIDFDAETTGATVTGTHNLPNPFQSEGNAAVNQTRITLRTEEEQQAAAREREEKERQELEKEIKSRREARRKSLANRRVSFAPEATLHTWDVVVEYQDSTASSSSTRRASSASAVSSASPHPSTPGPNSDPSEPPSTPPEQLDEETITATPEQQRDLHQKTRRRSSGIPPMNFNNPDDEFMSSSPFSGDSAGDEEEVVVEDDGSQSNSDDGDDDDDGTTMMSLDGGETTDMSMASIKSASSTASNRRLEEALSEAARKAGTRGIDYDEHGAQSEDEDVLASFTPWSKMNAAEGLESREDQENVNPFANGAQIPKPPLQPEESEGEEMTMDMTNAVGGILPSQQLEEDELSMDVTRAFGQIISNETSKPSNNRRKSVAPGRRQSTRRKSDNSSMGDETMDLTVAIGGIQPNHQQLADQSDEEMTMEFTSVVGGVLPKANIPSQNRRQSSAAAQARQKGPRESLDSTTDDATMDMTVAMGGIMPAASSGLVDEDDETMGMEMTTAIGGILQPQRSTGSRTRSKKVMELETDLGSSPFIADILTKSPPKPTSAVHTVASETGSPSLIAFKGKGLRRSTEARNSTTPKSRLSVGGTPIKKPTTPSKQLTPQPRNSATPSKTPPSKNVLLRSSSPRKLFKNEIKAESASKSSNSRAQSTPNKLFQQDQATGVATPSFVLTPKQRRSSGIGFDKEGLGSPRVAAILDRRRSIGEQAKSFTPTQPRDLATNAVRFEDPRIMENEIDDERARDMAREDGRAILEREVDQGEGEKDVTLNLKDLIQTLTPKRKPLKGRKSLHVGAATGILGKRPAELDDDDEDEDEGGVKRLKGHQGSPVKNVRLQAPPSKAETTGRLTRAGRKSLESTGTVNVTPTLSSPVKAKATTPRAQGRFKDAEAGIASLKIPPPTEKEPSENPEIGDEGLEDERIQLQDFLNMTNIRFMELTTTKRRHTIAPRSSAKDFVSDGPASMEDCVAAGAAIIPVLELYQHACTELKSYISEGRKTVREIETDTFEENPPLFREYINAMPDMKIVMDGQLKNVKTHARLVSKGTWYDWRMTLLTTLKEGLIRSAEGMIEDEEKLDEQQNLIQSVLPQLLRQTERLREEEADYRLVADELANCDPEELSNARQRLITVDADVEAKKRLIAELQKQLEGKEAEIEAGKVKKQQCQDEIREAEKVREECRGWTSTEISALKDKVEAIERDHGWTITGVSGNTTSMTYQRDIELVFDPSAFLTKNSTAKHPRNSRIDLWYIGTSRELNPQPITPEKEFFLQSIRDHVRGLCQTETPIRDLLRAVSTSWNKASGVVQNIRHLTVGCPTEITKTSDSSISVRSTLLIAPLATKVLISISLESVGGTDCVEVAIRPSATVVYGERFNEAKMGEFLLKHLGESVVEKSEESIAWGDVVADLGGRLLARGRK